MGIVLELHPLFERETETESEDAVVTIDNVKDGAIPITVWRVIRCDEPNHIHCALRSRLDCWSRSSNGHSCQHLKAQAWRIGSPGAGTGRDLPDLTSDQPLAVSEMWCPALLVGPANAARAPLAPIAVGPIRMTLIHGAHPTSAVGAPGTAPPRYRTPRPDSHHLGSLRRGSSCRTHGVPARQTAGRSVALCLRHPPSRSRFRLRTRTA